MKDIENMLEIELSELRSKVNSDTAAASVIANQLKNMLDEGNRICKALKKINIKGGAFYGNALT